MIIIRPTIPSLLYLILTAAEITVFGSPLPKGGGFRGIKGIKKSKSKKKKTKTKTKTTTTSSSAVVGSSGAGSGGGNGCSDADKKAGRCGNGKLSQKQITIIVSVVVIVVFLLLASLAIFLICRHRRKMKGPKKKKDPALIIDKYATYHPVPWWKKILPKKKEGKFEEVSQRDEAGGTEEGGVKYGGYYDPPEKSPGVVNQTPVKAS